MFCWTVHLNGAPKGSLCAAVAVKHKLYYFGGDCHGERTQIGVHVFNTVSLCWKKLPPVRAGRGEHHLDDPFVCSGRTAVLIEDIIYIWGGYNYNESEFYNVVYAFDVDSHRWFKPKMYGTVPEGWYWYDHSACVLGKVMYIYGAGRYYKDLYKLDTATMVWSLIHIRGTAPILPFGHTIVTIRTKIFVFGGVALGNNMGVFDTETNCWLSMPSAPLPSETIGSYGHSAFAYNGELYIYGGYNSIQTFTDLWKFNPETFTWKKVEPKGKRLPPKSWRSCCIVGDRVILFGGFDGQCTHHTVHCVTCATNATTTDDLYVLDLSPSLKTLCKLAVTQYGLERSELPHNIGWELAAMTKTKKDDD